MPAKTSSIYCQPSTGSPSVSSLAPAYANDDGVHGAGDISEATVHFDKPAVPGAAVVQTRQHTSDTPYDMLVVHDINLDGDGVVDLSVWNGRYLSKLNVDGFWQAVFANIGSHCRLLVQDHDDFCI